jgi:hypothetical protein
MTLRIRLHPLALGKGLPLFAGLPQVLKLLFTTFPRDTAAQIYRAA